uniref:Uncharacterized protein n=1 Tax=Arundo donax TaxID=35708 RepID=A0A0A9DU53_ARUDO
MLPLRRLPLLPLPHGPAPRRLLTAAASASLLPWPGLHSWRRAPPSHLRTWGPNGPCASDADEACLPEADAGAGSSLAEMGALVLSTADPLAKARLTHAAFSRWAAGLPVGQARVPDHPARPDKPVVVTQKEITTHKETGVLLNAYMLHNLADVELNAIDLSWDTVVRRAESENGNFRLPGIVFEIFIGFQGKRKW